MARDVIVGMTLRFASPSAMPHRVVGGPTHALGLAIDAINTGRQTAVTNAPVARFAAHTAQLLAVAPRTCQRLCCRLGAVGASHDTKIQQTFKVEDCGGVGPVIGFSHVHFLGHVSRQWAAMGGGQSLPFKLGTLEVGSKTDGTVQRLSSLSTEMTV